jgi:site-specific DNA-methyltransferase (adenine-specific)
LPARLIELYTYRQDLVLDPFVGSGTTAVAAVRSGRHYVGYDLDQSYVRLAESRVADERQRLEPGPPGLRVPVRLPAVPAPAPADERAQARAAREGRAAKEIAHGLIEAAGFTGIEQDQRQGGGVEVNVTAYDRRQRLWLFDVAGTFTSFRSGLKRTDTLWKALGKAAVLHQVTRAPLVLLTTDLPPRGSAAEALKELTGPGKPIYAVVEVLKPSSLEVLRALYEGKRTGPAGAGASRRRDHS